MPRLVHFSPSHLARDVGTPPSSVVQLLNQDGSDVDPNFGHAVVDTAGQTPGQFAYANVPANLPLAANQIYYLLSREEPGHDTTIPTVSWRSPARPRASGRPGPTTARSSTTGSRLRPRSATGRWTSGTRWRREVRHEGWQSCATLPVAGPGGLKRGGLRCEEPRRVDRLGPQRVLAADAPLSASHPCLRVLKRRRDPSCRTAEATQPGLDGGANARSAGRRQRPQLHPWPQLSKSSGPGTRPSSRVLVT
jgi:hypothetical protein